MNNKVFFFFLNLFNLLIDLKILTISTILTIPTYNAYNTYDTYDPYLLKKPKGINLHHTIQKKKQKQNKALCNTNTN